MAANKNASAPNNSSGQPQPGTTIAPGTAQSPQTTPVEPALPTPEPAVPPIPEPASDPEPEPPAEPGSNFSGVGLSSSGDDGQAVTWTASEFIAHNKSASWYALLIAGTLLLAALVFLVTRDFISVSVVAVAGLLLGVYGAHQPRQLEYVVDRRGIGIGPKYRSYDEFKSFSVVPEGAFSSLVFMPLKRFAVPTTIYYAPEDEDQIVSILTDHLPLEEHRADAVDSLMKHIRF